MRETLIISQMFSNDQQKNPKILIFLPFFVLIKEKKVFKKDPVEYTFQNVKKRELNA